MARFKFRTLASSFLLIGGLSAMALAQGGKLTRKDLVEPMEDADSFGKTVNFAGVLRGGSVILDLACDFQDELGPQDKCIITSGGPGPTPFNEDDLGSITLPGNTFRTNMYLIPTNFVNFEFFNTTPTPQGFALFRYQPYFTLESAALNDPRAIDPVSHLPLAGKVVVNFGIVKGIDQSLAVGERIHDQQAFSRATIAGITKAGLADMGVPGDVAERMFRGPITIRMGMKGNARLVDFAEMFWAARIMGN